MADQRGGGIAWTDVTWNPVRGCSRVSEGCRHCYAERQAARFSGKGKPYEGLIDEHGRWNGTVRLVPERLEDPLRWTKPRRVFVNSMSDLFHEGLADEDIDRVFAVMALAPRHVFQVLTKRPARMLNYLAAITGDEQRGEDFYAAMDDYNIEYDLLKQGWPLPNVWLGVSCEDQVTLDARVPLLLDTPASVRWVSFEPLLGPINLRGRPHSDLCIRCGKPSAAYHDHPDGYRTRGLDWVIVGGESGPDARPCDVAWVRDIVRQCKTSDVPAFVKQMGSNAYLDVRQNKTLPGWRRAFRDRKGADPEEWPIDLRVGEFPR